MIDLPARPEATFSVRSDGPFYQIHVGRWRQPWPLWPTEQECRLFGRLARTRA